MTWKMAIAWCRGHISGILSVFAILISLGSLWATYGEFYLHRDDMQYTFWKHINSAMEVQQRTISRAYKRIMKEEGVAYAVLGTIHGARLDCKDFNKVTTRVHVYNIRETDTAESSNESALIAEYGATILENRSLVSELRITGWSRFVKAKRFSDKWWINLAWNEMHIQFLSGRGGWRCTRSSMQPIRVSKPSMRLLKQALAIIQGDAIDVETYGGPNIMAIQNLESENESGRRATWSIKKQLGRVVSDSTHKVE